jgi:CheY-like chemotaxis protein
MVNEERLRPVEILLVEDNPGDILLTKEALEEIKIANNLNVVEDGIEAMNFLKNRGKYKEERKPDLIILDLNLPKKDGREVLAEVKESKRLRKIPVVILTSSEAEKDILKSYDLHANCFISKPIDLEQFSKIVKTISEFWFTIVKLPD